MIRGITFTIAAATGLLVIAPARAELTLCNRTSFRMEAAIGLEKRANVATRGWFRLDPGQCRQVMDGPFDAEMVYLHARTPPVYGSAPRPQDGQADFCIRNSDFEIPDARGCPASQQAHFSAAKPSESPKGPVVNLAEESDYDDVQSRLAGIQRLRVIAGYDAYPIDGVQGTKTQAAITKFLNDRKLPADTAAAPNFFDTLIEAARNPQGIGFSWCNDTHYAVMASLGIVEMGAIVTRGWYRVEAGQCVRQIRATIRIDSTATRRRSTPTAAQSGAARHRSPRGGTVPLCTRDGRFELADHKDCATRGLNSAGFAVIDLTGKPSTTVRFKEP